MHVHVDARCAARPLRLRSERANHGEVTIGDVHLHEPRILRDAREHRRGDRDYGGRGADCRPEVPLAKQGLGRLAGATTSGGVDRFGTSCSWSGRSLSSAKTTVDTMSRQRAKARMTRV